MLSSLFEEKIEYKFVEKKIKVSPLNLRSVIVNKLSIVVQVEL